MGMGWGQLYAGMDGDGDDLETSCGDRGGDGIRILGTGMGTAFPCSSLNSSACTAVCLSAENHVIM